MRCAQDRHPWELVMGPPPPMVLRVIAAVGFDVADAYVLWCPRCRHYSVRTGPWRDVLVPHSSN